MKKNKARVLLFDIETFPNKSFNWRGKHEQHIIAFEKEWELASFAYKWLGESKITCVDRYKSKDPTDKTLTKELWKVMNKADIIIAHNGNAFDIKSANSKFLEHKLLKPSSYKTIDTLKEARKHFKLNSNKLDDLANFLGIGRKMQHPGWPMWKGCMDGLRWAWRLMRKYNKHDVWLLEEVYKRLLPWINNHPNISQIENRPNGCPSCGSEHLQSRGLYRSKSGSYRRFQCQDCGSWCRERQENKKVEKPKYVTL